MSQSFLRWNGSIENNTEMKNTNMLTKLETQTFTIHVIHGTDDFIFMHSHQAWPFSLYNLNNC